MSMISKLCRISLVILLVLLCLGRANPVSAGNGEWTNIGPEGGQVLTIVINPVKPSTLYALTRAAIYKSIDGGENWIVSNNGLMVSHGVFLSGLVIDPFTPSTLYVFSMEGFYKSSNGGESWALISTQMIYAEDLLIDPITPTTFYLAGGINCHFGKSTDGGKTWTCFNTGLPERITTLDVDPVTPSTLYMGTYFGPGVLKSTDGGQHWNLINNGLPPGYGGSYPTPTIDGLAVDPVIHTTVYAATSEGLFKSTDSGGNWTKVAILPAFGADTITIDPTSHTTIYVGADGDVFKSMDGGGTWSLDAWLPNVSVKNIIVVDPLTPTNVYVGTDEGGVLKSIDGGATWASANTNLSAKSVQVTVIDPITPATLYLWASQELFKSTNGGETWAEVYTNNTGIGCDVAAAVIDPHTPSTLYIAGNCPFGGKGVFKSTDSGENWTLVTSGLPTVNPSALAIDPVNPNTIYFATSSIYGSTPGAGVFKSTNGGASWTALNAGLTNLDIRSLAIDPLNPTTLYAGIGNWNICNKDCGVYKSTNGGASWTVLDNPLTDAPIRVLAVDPVMTSTLYAVVFNGDIYKSKDGGLTWSKNYSGSFEEEVFALAIDPVTSTTLYAANNRTGVMRSTNGGLTWSAYNTGLTNPDVRTLTMHPDVPTTLYAGTKGGGVFLIQQIPPLNINHSKGAPGSAFTVTGTQFTPNSTATIQVNGHIVGTVPTDTAGNLSFTLTTAPETDEGYYTVSAETPIALIADTAFILEADETTYPPEGSADSFAVPDGIAYFRVMLPSIRKGN